jgi:hypothetical protein
MEEEELDFDEDLGSGGEQEELDFGYEEALQGAYGPRFSASARSSNL